MIDIQRLAACEAVRLGRLYAPLKRRQSAAKKSPRKPPMRGGDREGTMTVVSKKDVALSFLFGQQGEVVEDVKFFPGDSSSITEDDFWGEVHSALFQERMGSASVAITFHDDTKTVDAKAFLTSL